MRVLFYLHFYEPEPCAAAVRLRYFVNAVRQRGIDYEVVTPTSNYPFGKLFPGFKNRVYFGSDSNVTYLPIYLPGKPSVIKRFLSYLSYSVFSFFYLLKNSGRFDVVLTSSPPIFTAFSAAIFAKIKRAKFIFDVRDIWPDIGVEIGILKNRTVVKLLRSIEKYILAVSNVILVTAYGDKSNLINKGINPEKIEVVYNGVDSALFKPAVSEEKKLLRQRYRIPLDKKVLIYFGSFNHGMNDIQILGESLALLEEIRDKIFLVVIGEGENRNDFFSTIAGKIEYKHFLSADHTELPELVRLSDLSLVPRKLIKTDTGGNIPVKCFESWSAGVPVLLSNIGNTELSRIFNECGAGNLVPPGDSRIFAEAIRELIISPELENLGLMGRKFVADKFDRKTQSAAVVNLIEKITDE